MKSPTEMPTRETALPDRPFPVKTDEKHYVTGRSLTGPFPPGHGIAMFAMGCFWGSEHLFCQEPGVWLTAVGYSGGYTANPTYDDVVSGGTGHAEVVRIVFDPKRISYEDLLQLFWERHDPTSGMKQFNDEGTQYRSAIFCFNEDQRALAEATKSEFQETLTRNGFGTITTQIDDAGEFYFAESYHQAYLFKDGAQHTCIEGTGCRFTPRTATKSRD